MERYASGEDAAFAELYDALCPRLLGLVRRLLRDDALAEDIVQQTFFQMHRARGQFIRGADVVPWAFAIARHLVTDSVRRRRAEPISADGEMNAGEDRPSPEPAADEVLHARRVADRVEEEISRLPPRQRAAFELLREDGLSLGEAAEALGTTVAAVKLRAHRAYVALRAAVAAYNDDGTRK